MDNATLTEDDNIYCDCGAALTEADVDASGYQCARCHAASTFTCSDCGETFDNEEASPKCKTRCETCQETKDEAELEATTDALKDEVRDLAEAICDGADVTVLRKTVAALKRLGRSIDA
jgi:hypothetical protein